MSNLFGEYAEFYDLLYHDKVYPEEAAFVARLLDRCLSKPVAQTEILDIACGTGRHAQEWARMGYRVEGSDLSTEMVKLKHPFDTGSSLAIGRPNAEYDDCA